MWQWGLSLIVKMNCILQLSDIICGNEALLDAKSSYSIRPWARLDVFQVDPEGLSLKFISLNLKRIDIFYLSWYLVLEHNLIWFIQVIV